MTHSREEIFNAVYNATDEMLDAAHKLYIDTNSREFKTRMYAINLVLEQLGYTNEEYVQYVGNRVYSNGE